VLAGGGPLVVSGVVAVVLGGMVSAVSGPLGWERGSWASAFLVLVTGVSQVALGASRRVLGSAALSGRVERRRAVLWNVGSVAVLVGTVRLGPVVVTAGGALLLVGIVAFTDDVRTARRQPARWAYTALLAVLGMSVPIGVALSWGGG
jgi:hypothetical protein